MKLFHLLTYFLLAQAALAGSAFAGTLVKAPEPATLALVAVGIGGVAVLRKFRNRK